MGRGGNNGNVLYDNSNVVRSKETEATDLFALGDRELVIQNDKRVFPDGKNIDFDKEIIIEQQTVQQNKLIPSNITGFSVFTAVGESDNELVFVRQKDIDQSFASDNPYSSLRSAPSFTYLNDLGAKMVKEGCAAEDLFDDQPDRGEWNIHDLKAFASKEEVEALLKTGKLKEDRLVFFNGDDYSLWRANQDLPVKTVYSYNLGSKYYDINKLEKELNNHPWVKQVDRVDVPYYNQDLSGKEELQVKLFPDQETWDEIMTIEANNSKSKKYARNEDFFSVDSWEVPYQVLKKMDIKKFEKPE